VWDNVEKAVGTVVISHGMAEHAGRYDDFASFLNENNFYVLALNHRGHKYNNAGEKGMVKGDSYAQSVEDIHTLVTYAKEKYGKEVVLFGHSYGSFLAQRYIELYSEDVKACILSGTAYMKSALISMGRAIANFQRSILGPDKKGKLINTLSFGAYNKPFKEQKQKFAWLSRDKAQVEKYENDEYCGYVLSLGFYSSFFNGLHSMYGPDSDGIRKDIPILIAVGSKDPVSNNAVLAHQLYDFYMSKELTKVEIKVYEDARHEILNEINNDEVYKDMLAFINAQFA
jgi:alpha-beta hydrolase superfamily lysophospholipase